MRRIVSILLCLCVLVVCALGSWFGHSQLNSPTDGDDSQNSPLARYSCTQLLEKIPRNLDEFELTGFYPGKQYVAIDADDDGRWERVYVPVFDRPLKDIRRNYRAIVLCFAGVVDEIELRKELQNESIKSQYWSYSQKFDYDTYNSLAERYTSLDFDRSIIIHSGFPKSAGIAKYLYWGGALGALLACLGMGWQTVGLIGIAIRKSAAIEREQDDEDDDEPEFANRAGLPTIERD